MSIPLAKPLAIVIPHCDNSKANFLVKFLPFSLQERDPTIEIIGLFNNSKFPCIYNFFGGLGIFCNDFGYNLLLNFTSLT